MQLHISNTDDCKWSISFPWITAAPSRKSSILCWTCFIAWSSCQYAVPPWIIYLIVWLKAWLASSSWITKRMCWLKCIEVIHFCKGIRHLCLTLYDGRGEGERKRCTGRNNVSFLKGGHCNWKQRSSKGVHCACRQSASLQAQLQKAPYISFMFLKLQHVECANR